ncbi:hypothetical protein [Candidatus Thiosymbion oneisti]|uniref:hypothetical protein n=1 Tax=Candidatus Thiosymbion oneisti TaxID=589554 RepID=UPI00114CE2C0|nr:hypothetical protein [Candidatus Thiosymbion oneisti]
MTVSFTLTLCFALALRLVFTAGPCPLGCLGVSAPGSSGDDAAVALGFGVLGSAVFFALALRSVFAAGLCLSGRLGTSATGSNSDDTADALGVADRSIGTDGLAGTSLGYFSKISVHELSETGWGPLPGASGDAATALRFGLSDSVVFRAFVVGPCLSGCLGAPAPGSSGDDAAITLRFGILDSAVFFALVLLPVFAAGLCLSGRSDASAPRSNSDDTADALGVADRTTGTDGLAGTSLGYFSKISVHELSVGSSGDTANALRFGLSDLVVFRVSVVGPCLSGRLSVSAPGSSGGNTAAALRCGVLDSAVFSVLVLRSVFAAGPCLSGRLGASAPGSSGGNTAVAIRCGVLDSAVFFVLVLRLVFAAGSCLSGRLGTSAPRSNSDDTADALSVADGTIGTGCLAGSSLRCFSKSSIKGPSEAVLGTLVTASCSLENTEGSPSVNRVGSVAGAVPTPD